MIEKIIGIVCFALAMVIFAIGFMFYFKVKDDD